MKNYTQPLHVTALLLALTLTAPAITRADSDEVTTWSTTTTQTAAPSQGPISEFDPNSFEIRESASAATVRYSYTKTTTYVDENGNPVSMEMVKSGAPVTVFYDRNGDQMVASKVVVRAPAPAPAAATQTTTTTTRTHRDDDKD